jgi:hypothetical protein
MDFDEGNAFRQSFVGSLSSMVGALGLSALSLSKRLRWPIGKNT